MVRSFLIATLLLFTHTAFASPQLAEEFKSTWVSGYKAGQCGQNIMDLLNRAQAKGIDVSNARIVSFNNDGYLLSVMHRRGAGVPLEKPIGDIRSAPGIRNFYFHAVLEKDGLIYDYDFGNEPQIVPIQDYIRRMFWEEPFPKQKYIIYDPLKEREDYLIEFISAKDYLNGVEKPASETQDLSDFYDSFRTPVFSPTIPSL